MKRSKVKKEILKILKKWESCKIESKTAEEVLSKIEELGMLPPRAKVLGRSKLNDPYSNEWEKE